MTADRHTLQAEGKHPAPCARFCEANAFRIELRQRDSYIEFLEARRNVLERLTATHDELLLALKNLVGLARMGAAPLKDYKAALAVADAAIQKATGGAHKEGAQP